MDKVNGFETQIVKLAKDLPHLPKATKKWLADYAWILTIIGIILGLVAIWNSWRVISAADAIMGWAAAWGASTSSYDLAKVHFYLVIVASLILISAMAAAVVPLKEKKRLGWAISFYALLASAALTLLSIFFNFEAFLSVIFSMIGFAFSLYMLFEVREYFMPTHHVDKKVDSSVKTEK